MTAVTTPGTDRVGTIIRNAVVFNIKNWSDKRMADSDLLASVDRLFKLLSERATDYVLVGGIAMLQYVDGRNTEDIDLIMSLAALSDVPEIAVVSQDSDFVQGRFEGLRIDVLLAQNALFERVRQAYRTVQHFQDRDIACASVTGLLVLKLYALPSLYRQGDFTRVGLYENDISTLLYTYRPDVEPLFAELATHLSRSDLESLRTIVGEMQVKIDRFRADFDTK